MAVAPVSYYPGGCFFKEVNMLLLDRITLLCIVLMLIINGTKLYYMKQDLVEIKQILINADVTLEESR